MAHRDGASYLMAVQSWSEASPYILYTGQEVLAMGGFTGVDGTFTWTASHDQRQCSLSTVSFAAAIVVGPEPRSSWSARSEASTNDLDGGENVGDQLDLPAGGCEDGAVAITEGVRTPRAAAPSFRSDRRFGATYDQPDCEAARAQIIRFWSSALEGPSVRTPQRFSRPVRKPH